VTVIADIDALEILDSRGNPTLQVAVTLESGLVAVAGVPSGASTGMHEAAELRDGGTRYGGRGVRRAVDNVRQGIRSALVGLDVTDQAEIDRTLIDLDGTPNKARLGANAIIGASMAVARAGAASAGLPLYRYLGGADACRLPVPMMNVINGGKHAANRLEFQEFMIVPHGAPSFTEAVRYGAETFHALKSLLEARGFATGVGDEGGFAPDLAKDEDACALIVEAIEAAGFRPGTDIAIALDPAASSFFADGAYQLPTLGAPKSSAEMIALYEDWIARFPIVLIEDGLAEEDWSGFQAQTRRIGDRIEVMGDDLYVTNPAFIRRGIETQATNAVLIKLNQIGTVTETIAAIELCREAGWRFMVSHRSGETVDSFIADFAVAMGGGQLKAGSLSRGERLAKYNRLLEIERELGVRAQFVSSVRPTQPKAKAPSRRRPH
jgi:enolase